MKLSYNERTGQLTEKSMSGNLWQSSKLKQGANVIVATPGQLVHYMKSHVIRKGSTQILLPNEWATVMLVTL